MSFKFKVGDKVRVVDSNPMFKAITGMDFIGKEGEVTQLGGAATPDKGAVVTSETFPSGCGENSYGERGYWFSDDLLELVQTQEQKVEEDTTLTRMWEGA